MKTEEIKERLGKEKANLIKEMKVHTTDPKRLSAMLNYVFETALKEGEEYLEECECANGAEWVAKNAYQETMTSDDVYNMYNDVAQINNKRNKQHYYKGW